MPKPRLFANIPGLLLSASLWLLAGCSHKDELTRETIWRSYHMPERPSQQDLEQQPQRDPFGTCRASDLANFSCD